MAKEVVGAGSTLETKLRVSSTDYAVTEIEMGYTATAHDITDTGNLISVSSQIHREYLGSALTDIDFTVTMWLNVTAGTFLVGGVYANSEIHMEGRKWVGNIIFTSKQHIASLGEGILLRYTGRFSGNIIETVAP